MTKPSYAADRLIWTGSRFARGQRAIPEETAIALTYNGGTYAVMMATPRDLTDFAIGFSLSEGIVDSPAQLQQLDVIEVAGGIELRMWLSQERADRLNQRRRHIAGPTGCGLCGIDSISEAVRPAATIWGAVRFSSQQIMTAMQLLPVGQKLNIEIRAVHGAAFWSPAKGIVVLREDVGRHNALDKLSGALAQQGIAAAEGIVLLTSRVSVEMVQKTAVLGASVMVSVSAQTALAVRIADAAGITLTAIARADSFEIFTHPQRIAAEDVVSIVA